jgi:hypothetical protein
MSQNVVFVYLKPFVRQWAEHLFGSPMRFPSRSVGNARLLSVLQKRPSAALPPADQAPGRESAAVVIPCSRGRLPEYWCHLTPDGRHSVEEWLESVFADTLWSDLHRFTRQRKMSIQDACYEWCRQNGVSFDYADTLRQRFYRERVRLTGLIRGGKTDKKS